MPSYNSTARMPFKTGGKVDSKKRTVSSSKTKAFRKAKDKKEDLRFMKIIHEKKFGDRPKLRKKTPLSTATGYGAATSRKYGTAQTQSPKSKKNPLGYKGTYPKGSVDKRLKA